MKTLKRFEKSAFSFHLVQVVPGLVNSRTALLFNVKLTNEDWNVEKKLRRHFSPVRFCF